MSGDISAEQVINLWKNAHGVELTELQEKKLYAAVSLIAEGSYVMGKKDALADIAKGEDTDEEEYLNSRQEVLQQSCPGCGCLDEHRDWCLRKDIELPRHGSS